MQVSYVLGPTRVLQIHVVLSYETRQINKSLDLYCLYRELRHIAPKLILFYISEPNLESYPCGVCEIYSVLHIHSVRNWVSSMSKRAQYECTRSEVAFHFNSIDVVHDALMGSVSRAQVLTQK